MTVTLNGEQRDIPDAVTVRGLLRDLALADSAVAVAVNSEFVPRSQHESHVLQAGDAIELVAPMQGG